MMARVAASENSTKGPRSGTRGWISNVQPDRDEPQVFDTGIRAEDLDPARPQPLDTPWGSFALYVVDGRILASQSFCPHLEGPLFYGSIVGTEVTCPWHRWRFDLVTGERLDSPDEAHRLKRCRVRKNANGTLELEAPRDGGSPST